MQYSRTASFLLVALLLVLLLAIGLSNFWHTATPPPTIETYPITLELSHGGELAPGEIHRYCLDLATGTYVGMTIEKQRADLVAEIWEPGEESRLIDNTASAVGLEPISFMAQVSGLHCLDLRLASGGEAGGYSIRLGTLREATPEDRLRLAAEAALAAAENERSRGSLRTSVEKYEKSGELWRRVGDATFHAVTMQRLAEVWSQLGDLQREISCYKKARSNFQQLGRHRSEVVVLNNLGRACRRLGEWQQALDAYRQALQLAQSTGYRRGEARTLNNIAVLFSIHGEVRKSLNLYESALAMWRGLEDRFEEANTLHNIGRAYGRLQRTQDALDHLEEALARYQTMDAPRDEAATLTAIGQIYLLEKDTEKAVEYNQRAIELRKMANDVRGAATTLDSLGMTYEKLGMMSEALAAFERALVIYQELGEPLACAHILANIGQLYLDWDQLEKASDSCLMALQSFRRLETPDRIGEAQALFIYAKTLHALGRPAEALALMEGVLGIVESYRSRPDSQTLRSSFFAWRREYYELYVELRMQLHRREPGRGYDVRALEATERIRARSLLESLSEHPAQIREGVDPSLLAEESAVRARLSAAGVELERRLRGSDSHEALHSLERTIRKLRVQLQRIDAEIRARSPRFAALPQPQPLSLAEIQQQVLDPDSLLLVYWLGRDQSYLWLIDEGSLSSYPLPGRKEIEPAAEHLYELYSESYKENLRGQVEIEAASLSDLLLGPVGGRLGFRRLVIVAGGKLQYLPFAALPKPPHPDFQGGESARNAGANRPLIVDHEIVILPSASVLAALRRQRRGCPPGCKKIAILADPVFAAADPRVKRQARGPLADSEPGSMAGLELMTPLEKSASDLGMPAFERLHGSRREARRIAGLLPPDQCHLALDFRASREAVLSGRLRSFEILHFATHGLLHPDYPELSGIVLSLVDEKGSAQDGFLRLHDVYHLDLSAELVVLSACKSALGKGIRGEGLWGLPRGFLYAGAARVLVSLWSVNDQATARLMEELYRGILEQGLQPAAALRRAQVTMRGQQPWSDPYYWAGFIVQGEWKN